LILPFKGDSQVEGLAQKVSSDLDVSCSRKVKPRAIVFKAHGNDLDKIKDLIKTQFPDVEILYVTSGPAECFLRVTKSLPFEGQDCSVRSFYTVEGL